MQTSRKTNRLSFRGSTGFARLSKPTRCCSRGWRSLRGRILRASKGRPWTRRVKGWSRCWGTQRNVDIRIFGKTPQGMCNAYRTPSIRIPTTRKRQRPSGLPALSYQSGENRKPKEKIFLNVPPTGLVASYILAVSFNFFQNR